MQQKKYTSIATYCETCFDKYGDNHLGVGWTKTSKDADTRHQVMLDVIKPNTQHKVKLLDFGCGVSQLYEYILRNKIENIEYSGADISETFINFSRNKFPNINYYQLDILEEETILPKFDYIITSGIFTIKIDLSYEEMLLFFQATIAKLFSRANIGIAFNTATKQVDWERDDLFHLPFDALASFLTKKYEQELYHPSRLWLV